MPRNPAYFKGHYLHITQKQAHKLHDKCSILSNEVSILRFQNKELNRQNKILKEKLKSKPKSRLQKIKTYFERKFHFHSYETI